MELRMEIWCCWCGWQHMNGWMVGGCMGTKLCKSQRQQVQFEPPIMWPLFHYQLRHMCLLSLSMDVINVLCIPRTISLPGHLSSMLWFYKKFNIPYITYARLYYSSALASTLFYQWLFFMFPSTLGIHKLYSAVDLFWYSLNAVQAVSSI